MLPVSGRALVQVESLGVLGYTSTGSSKKKKGILTAHQPEQSPSNNKVSESSVLI
jgi:hypothetical protein